MIHDLTRYGVWSKSGKNQEAKIRHAIDILGKIRRRRSYSTARDKRKYSTNNT